jgi:outer membrane protein assembly factor BamB
MMMGSVITSSMPVNSEDDSTIGVEVMIDFGNGIVKWAKVDLDTNKTAINATEKACEKLDLTIGEIWFSFGVFVNEIGGLSSPDDWSWYWLFLIWNNTLNVWEGSSEGASNVELDDGDIIGWSPSSSKPLATPYAKYPWATFQVNALNLGTTENIGPESNAVGWIFDTGTIELAASPVVAQNMVVVNNWGGTFCLSEEGELLWKTSEVKGVFSPTIGIDKVLVGGKDGFLYSLNITNGEILWKTEITQNPGLSGVASPAKIVNDRIYLGSFDFNGGTGYLYCLNEEDGQVLWKNITLSSVYFSSPSVAENRVFIGTMGLYNSSNLKWNPPYGLFCFDAKNGEHLWNYSVDGSVGSSPTIVDDKVLFTSKDGHLYCLDTANGNPIWKKDIGDSVSSPAIWQNKIFVGSGEMSGEGKFYSIDMKGIILWEFEPNGAVQSSPAVAGDLVYFATNVKNGTIYCLDNSNGQLVWQYQPWPEEYIISSPAVVEGRLYIASDNGRLYCFYGDTPKFIVNITSSTQKINVGEDVIFVHNDQENRLRLTSITQNAVSLKIDSMEVEIEVKVGRAPKVDTDGDGSRDLMISIDNLNTSAQTASLSLDVYHEPQNTEDERVPIALLIGVIVVVAFIIAGVVVNLKRRR